MNGERKRAGGHRGCFGTNNQAHWVLYSLCLELLHLICFHWDSLLTWNLCPHVWYLRFCVSLKKECYPWFVIYQHFWSVVLNKYPKITSKNHDPEEVRGSFGTGFNAMPYKRGNPSTVPFLASWVSWWDTVAPCYARFAVVLRLPRSSYLKFVRNSFQTAGWYFVPTLSRVRQNMGV